MLKCLNVKMNKKGFTLLEVIVAIFLVTVGISGVFLLITRTIGIISLSFSQLTAAYLTQEGIEIVRNVRDTNWLDPLNPSWDDGLSAGNWEADYTTPTLNDTYDGDLLNIDGDGFYSYSPGTPTKFKRRITIVPEDIDLDGINDILKVTVLVEWQEKGKIHSHTAQENLYNWK